MIVAGEPDIKIDPFGENSFECSGCISIEKFLLAMMLDISSSHGVSEITR